MNLHLRFRRLLTLPVLVILLIASLPVQSVESANLAQNQFENESYVYLPLLRNPYPTLFLVPGTYPFEDLCHTFELNLKSVYGIPAGHMKECVTSVVVNRDGTMQFNFSWTFIKHMYFEGCLNKQSDAENPDMYIKDLAGNRYDHIEVGGYAWGYNCMPNNIPIEGWFLFPRATTRNADFIFYDDDNRIQIDPIHLTPAP